MTKLKLGISYDSAYKKYGFTSEGYKRLWNLYCVLDELFNCEHRYVYNLMPALFKVVSFLWTDKKLFKKKFISNYELKSF